MDTDFYIYGGFDVTVNAFVRIALIFNDGEYVVLFFVATMFGIVFGGAIAFGQGLMGKGGDGAAVISFFILVLVGVAVFKGLILPKGTVHIYDPVVNRYQAVGGVPDLIVFAARLCASAFITRWRCWAGVADQLV
jgi:conjugal transfer mating pair stabilization protein TraG